MQDDRDHLNLLLRVPSVLHSPRSLEEIMGDLIGEVIATLQADRGFVVLRRGDDWFPLATHYQDPLGDHPNLRFSLTVVKKVAVSGSRAALGGSSGLPWSGRIPG